MGFLLVTYYHTHTHAHAHIRTHARTHTHTHIYIYIYIRPVINDLTVNIMNPRTLLPESHYFLVLVYNRYRL